MTERAADDFGAIREAVNRLRSERSAHRECLLRLRRAGYPVAPNQVCWCYSAGIADLKVVPCPPLIRDTETDGADNTG